MSFFCNCGRDLKRLREELLLQHKQTNTKLDLIIMTQAEVQAALELNTITLGKVRKEQEDRFKAEALLVEDLTKKVEELSKLIEEGGAATPGVEAALAEFTTTLEAFDETIPDRAA